MVANNSFNIYTSFGRDYGVDYKFDEEMKAVILFQGYPQSLLTFAVVCCLLFVLIGVPGNLFTIIALAKCRQIRNSTAIFIINLHVADLILCCTILPLTVTTFAYNHWVYGISMCRAYGFLKFILIAINMFTIVAIALNRYVMVCHPTFYSNLYKRRNLSIMILSIWAAGFAIFVPSIFGTWGRYGLHPTGGFCTLLKDKHNRSPKMLLWAVTLTGSYIIMGLCYARIWWVVRKTAKNSRKNYNSSNVVVNQDASNSSSGDTPQTSVIPLATIQEGEISSSPAVSPRETDNTLQRYFRAPFRSTKRENRPKLPTKRDKRLCTMIVAIMLSFCITHGLVMTTKLIFKDYRKQPVLTVLVHLLGFLGRAINPLIYVLMSKEYRQAYKKIFESIWKRFQREQAANV